MAQLPTPAMQGYLKAIHALGGANAIVSMTDLAHRLAVRAASVTGMLKRLSEGGWIIYSPGRGAQAYAAGNHGGSSRNSSSPAHGTFSYTRAWARLE